MPKHKLEHIPVPHRESTDAANDNVKPEAANDNEHIEKPTYSYDSVVSGLSAEIQKAPEGAVIFVSGLYEDEFERSVDIARERGMLLVDTDNNFGSVESTVRTNEKQRIYFNRERLLSDILFGSSQLAQTEKAQHLLHRVDNPEEALLEWLEEATAGNEEGNTDTPGALVRKMIDNMRALTKGNRPVLLELAATSPIGLLLLTFAREGKVDAGAIRRTYEKYPPINADKLVTVRLDDEIISAFFAGSSLGSRRIYDY